MAGVAVQNRKGGLAKQIWECRMLYLFLLPAIVYLLLFCYWPMYGIQIAFRNYTLAGGITTSPWAGMKWFNYFFESKNFAIVIRNTISISLYGLAAGFPIPIVLALMLNYAQNQRFKRVVQTISYMPHFISTVVFVGMISVFFSTNGFINTLIAFFGGSRSNILGNPAAFIHVYVWSGVWQGMGWGSIIYMAALTGVNPELHEAAIMDGATLLRRIWHIDIPAILPTIVTLLVMNCGSIMSVGFEKVFLMQNTFNLNASEVISTYTYKMGMTSQKYSYSTAIGLFNNIINFILLSVVNTVSNKITGYGMW